MIELDYDQLLFSFSEVHPDACLKITFQRTLRIPDDNTDYPLPPGIGNFPLCHVDDYPSKIPKEWLARGGVMLPMYQSEAMWIDFRPCSAFEHDTIYPFAVKIATGKINAVNGDVWDKGLKTTPQNYVVVPKQPWLDGYCIAKGIVRQFVGMPLGTGYSSEEQITGQAEYGGVQIQVYPMGRDIFEQRFPKVRDRSDLTDRDNPVYCRKPQGKGISLAPGGRIRQEIYTDPFDVQDWDMENTSRCFVHLVNSVYWRDITGEVPPTWLPTAADYSEAGLPWFEHYQEDPDIEANTTRRPLQESEDASGQDVENPSFIAKQSKENVKPGSGILAKLKSVFRIGKEKGEQPLPENTSAQPKNIVSIKNKQGKKQIGDGDW